MLTVRFRMTLVSIFAALSVLSCQRSQVQSERRVVNLATWPNYISAETLAEFEKQKGIQVQVAHYSSNEELLAKLQTGASLFDVALPADYMVLILTKLNLLDQLDKEQLPVAKQLDPEFLNKAYDLKNEYSLPFDRGTTGIAVNRRLFSGKMQSWKDFFSQAEVAQKFTLLDDMREGIGAALKSLGYSLNSKNPEELRQAREVLLKVKKRLKAFTSEPNVPLANGEIAVAQAFSTDTLQARKLAKGDIEYVYPKEGGVLWMDNLIIPKTAPHKKEAYELINFLLGPKVSANTAMNYFVAPSNLQTLALLPDSIRKDPAVFPSEEIVKRYEMIQDLGEVLVVWDRIWTEVKVH